MHELYAISSASIVAKDDICFLSTEEENTITREGRVSFLPFEKGEEDFLVFSVFKLNISACIKDDLLVLSDQIGNGYLSPILFLCFSYLVTAFHPCCFVIVFLCSYEPTTLYTQNDGAAR